MQSIYVRFYTFTASLFLLAALFSTAPKAQAQNLFVAGYESGNVDEYTLTGTFVREFIAPGSGGLSHASGLAFGGDGNLYVTSGFNAASGSVKKYNGTTGAYLGEFATSLADPSDITFDSTGNAYVVEYSRNRVQKYSSAGTVVQTYTSNLSNPYGLTISQTGSLLVTNYGHATAQSIVEFDTSGNSSIFATGIGAGVGIATGSDGRYYVGDYAYDGGSNKVKVISASGGSASDWNIGGTLNGTSFIASVGGNIFATSYYNNAINRFDGTTGVFISSFSGPVGPQGITVKPLASDATPEPGSLALLGTLVLAGAGFFKQRKNKIHATSLFTSN